MGASQVYQEMRAAGIRPDVCTFIHLFEVCSYSIMASDVLCMLPDCHAIGTGRRACRSVPDMIIAMMTSTHCTETCSDSLEQCCKTLGPGPTEQPADWWSTVAEHQAASHGLGCPPAAHRAQRAA